MRRSGDSVLRAVVLAIGLACIPEVTNAQFEPARVLVITAWAEAGTQAPAEWAAIWHALANRAATVGTRADRLAKRYSTVFRARSKRSKWLLEIRRPCSVPPESWPKNVRWVPDDCRVMFAAADAFLRGELPDPLAGQACDWSAATPAMIRRAAFLRLKRVKGPMLSNYFYEC